MIISLSGFMGCGKSSVGKELSAMLGWPFIDLDSYIEEQTSRTIPEIFESEGESAFRAMELKSLLALLSPAEDSGATGAMGSAPAPPDSALAAGSAPDFILSLGGGTLTTPQCAELIHKRTLCIYLSASTDTLIENLQGGTQSRPMLSGTDTEASLRARIEDLLSSRESIYKSSAHHTVLIDGKSNSTIATEISLLLPR